MQIYLYHYKECQMPDRKVPLSSLSGTGRLLAQEKNLGTESLQCVILGCFRELHSTQKYEAPQ